MVFYNLSLSVPKDVLLPHKPDPEVSESESGKWIILFSQLVSVFFKKYPWDKYIFNGCGGKKFRENYGNKMYISFGEDLVTQSVWSFSLVNMRE